MMEYTEDVNIKNFEALQNKGMLISDGDEESYVDWSKEVKTAFAGLKRESIPKCSWMKTVII